MVKHLFLLSPMVLVDHKYRKNRKNFFIGRVERDVAQPIPSSEKLYDVVL